MKCYKKQESCHHSRAACDVLFFIVFYLSAHTDTVLIHVSAWWWASNHQHPSFCFACSVYETGVNGCKAASVRCARLSPSSQTNWHDSADIARLCNAEFKRIHLKHFPASYSNATQHLGAHVIKSDELDTHVPWMHKFGYVYHIFSMCFECQYRS